MEISTETAARLLGISQVTILRYGDAGRLQYRAHGLRGRRRYDLDYLRSIAPTLNLRFDEEEARKLQQVHP